MLSMHNDFKGHQEDKEPAWRLKVGNETWKFTGFPGKHRDKLERLGGWNDYLSTTNESPAQDNDVRAILS